MKTIKIILIFIFAISLAEFVACEGPPGPQGEQGLQGAEGPQGPEGAVNATLYKFDGHNFSIDDFTELSIDLENEAEMQDISWLVYLVFRARYFFIPGAGVNQVSSYYVLHHWETENSRVRFVMGIEHGAGEEYDEIHIIKIHSSNVVDNRSKTSAGIVPENLNVEDYHSVIEYFDMPE